MNQIKYIPLRYYRIVKHLALYLITGYKGHLWEAGHNYYTTTFK